MRNIEIINTNLYSAPGLYQGKMGMILYNFLYARHTGNSIYEEQAMDIIHQLEEELPFVGYSYSNGLAGIGSAFCFLVDHGFVEARPDQLLSDFDGKMFSVVYFAGHRDLSFQKGLTGIGYYYLYRIKSRSGTNPFIFMEHKMVLLSILDILSARFNMNGFTYPVNELPAVSPLEIADILLFLQELKQLGICDELVNRLYNSIVKKYGPDESDLPLFSISSRVPAQLKIDSMSTVLKKISMEKNDTILPMLAALSLENPSLPPWWILF